MFSTKKGGVFLLLCVLLFSLSVTISIAPSVNAATGVVPVASCDPNSIIVYLTADTNAHASLTSGGNYPDALCFTSLVSPSQNAAQSLQPSNPAQNTMQRFGNEVMSLSDSSNAHVEGPASDQYSFVAPFGYLDCRLSATDNHDATKYEQVIGQLSSTTNAHFAKAGDATGKFPNYLICKELVCSATPSQTVYPLIESFEDTTSAIFAAGAATPPSQVSISQDSTKSLLGANSLKLTYLVPSSPTAPLVASFPLAVKNNWNGYGNLEFYIWVDSVLSLDVRITSGANNQQTTIPISLAVSASPNGIQKGRWNLIRIPLSMIADPSTVKSIDFIVDPTKYLNAAPGASIVYYVDALQLSGDNSDPNHSRYYCAGTLQADQSTKYFWTTTLAGTASNWFATTAPWVTATSTASASSTTAQKTCGDILGQTFADGTFGCFNSTTTVSGAVSGASGNVPLIKDGTVFDSLVIPQLSSANGGLESTFCFGSVGQSGGMKCRIATPPLLVGKKIDFNSTTNNIVFDSFSGTSQTITIAGGSQSSNEILTGFGGSQAVSVRGLISTTASSTQQLQMGFSLSGTGTANIQVQFDSSNVIPGEISNPNFVVSQNGNAISANADKSFTVSTASPTNIVVSAPSQTTGETVLEVSVLTPSIGVIEFSGRGAVTATQQIILGFLASGANVRAIADATGKKLSDAGVSGVTADPALVFNLVSPTQSVVGVNNDWQQLSTADQSRLGAYAPSASDAKAAAYPLDVVSGDSYTLNVNGTAGEALGEISFVKVSTPVSNSPTSTQLSIPDTLVYNISRPRFVYGNETHTSAAGYNYIIPANQIGQKFYSCAVSSLPSAFSSFTNVNPVSATVVGQQCPVVSGFACSPEGYFTNKNMSDDGNMSVVATAGTQSGQDSEKFGCCPVGQCYAAGQCWQNQTYLAGSKPIQLYASDSDRFRCEGGSWQTATPKQNFDGSDFGYCPSESQCLVTSNPTAGQPSCINSGDYYQNYYCDGRTGVGTWTSKTAILASQMINYARGTLGWSNGTLYCDDYTSTLNVLSTSSDNSLQTSVSAIFKGINSANGYDCSTSGSSLTGSAPDPCVNNFCVFAPDPSISGAKPIFGTSLNRNFSTINNLGSVFESTCANLDGAYNPSQAFAKCSGNNNYQYNSNLSLVLYDPNVQGFFASSWTSIKNFFADIFGGTQAKAEYSVIPQSQLFTRFYYTYNKDPSINPSLIAFNERRYNNQVGGAVSYYVFSINTAPTPMTVNICNDIVIPFNQQQNKNSPNNWVNCTGTATSALVVGDLDGHADKLWPKLTGQLRPNVDFGVGPTATGATSSSSYSEPGGPTITSFTVTPTQLAQGGTFAVSASSTQGQSYLAKQRVFVVDSQGGVWTPASSSTTTSMTVSDQISTAQNPQSFYHGSGTYTLRYEVQDQAGKSAYTDILMTLTGN